MDELSSNVHDVNNRHFLLKLLYNDVIDELLHELNVRLLGLQRLLNQLIIYKLILQLNVMFFLHISLHINSPPITILSILVIPNGAILHLFPFLLHLLLHLLLIFFLLILEFELLYLLDQL